MTRDDIVRMFHEAGESAGWKPGFGNPLVINYLAHFADLAVAAERASHQAVQIQNEQLREQLARSGIEQRQAIQAEREACATIDVTPLDIRASDGPGTAILKYQAAIRKRSQPGRHDTQEEL